MSNRPIISTEELALHIGAPDWKIFDCRFDLLQPELGKEQYLQGHIPGALFMDLNKDLSNPVTVTSGRHPLPAASTFIEKLSNAGVTSTTNVVVYDAHGGAYASRLWYMLRLLHHEMVFVLDGGIQKWQRENRHLESGEAREQVAVTYGVQPFDQNLIATEADVLAAIESQNSILIDARSPERYRGESEPIDPVAGHIPTATNRFHGENLNPDGTFKAPEILQAELTLLLGPHPTKDTIVYCGSGVTSCHHILAMRIARLPAGKVYIGSWSEWIKNSENPVSTASTQ